MSKRVIAVPLQGGKVAANPQFQDTLRQAGLDPSRVVEEVQKKVSSCRYPIQKVELEIWQGGYEVNIHLPPVGDLFLKLVGKDTGAHNTNEVIGNLTFRQLAEIAVYKRGELKSRSFKSALKQLLSTCKAMGITVDGKPAAEVMKELDMGKYDEMLKEYD
ncbi:MAG: 50S ribosomal protein L11 [Pyrobaculum sp.]